MATLRAVLFDLHATLLAVPDVIGALNARLRCGAESFIERPLDLIACLGRHGSG
jgi:hypothetical protein